MAGFQRPPARTQAERMRDRRLRDAQRLSPLDIAILEKLPKVGTMMGLRPLGMTNKGLVEHLRGIDPEIDHNMVAGVLKSLEFAGFVRVTKLIPVSQGLGFQKTEEGVEALRIAKADTPQEPPALALVEQDREEGHDGSDAAAR